MGMYDTFMTNNKFKCQSCSKEVSFEHGVQTKMFECYLEVFSPFDMPMDIEENRQVVEEYDWCPYCSKSIPIFFSFHSGIYVEAFDTFEEAEYSSDNFDIITAYSMTYKDKVKFTNNFNSMRNILMSVCDLHSKKPIKSRFSTLMTLRQSDVLDYNIMTTLKNIIEKYNPN